MVHLFKPNFSTSDLYFFFLKPQKCYSSAVNYSEMLQRLGESTNQVCFWLVTFYCHHFISRISQNPEPKLIAFIDLIGMVLYFEQGQWKKASGNALIEKDSKNHIARIIIKGLSAGILKMAVWVERWKSPKTIYILKIERI